MKVTLREFKGSFPLTALAWWTMMKRKLLTIRQAEAEWLKASEILS